MFVEDSIYEIIDRAMFDAKEIYDYTKARAAAAAAPAVDNNGSFANLYASSTATTSNPGMHDAGALSMIEPTPIGSTIDVVDSIDIRDATNLDSGVRSLCKSLIHVETPVSDTDGSIQRNIAQHPDQSYDDYITMSFKRQKMSDFPSAYSFKWYPPIERMARDRRLGVSPTTSFPLGLFQTSHLDRNRPPLNAAHHSTTASVATSATISSRTPDDHNHHHKEDSVEGFREYHSANWTVQYEAMVQFHAKTGHCFVPYNYPENPRLSMWVKRQRYQYKLKQYGRHNTVTADRQAKLDALGFVWDSHKAIWEERYSELVRYRKVFGRTDVPFQFHNKKLAIWVKYQRRQHRLYRQGKQSSITPERIAKLNEIDFEWGIDRKVKGKLQQQEEQQQQVDDEETLPASKS